MLKAENLLIRQGGFTLGAEFQIKAGTRNAVLGPSGAGKSTLLGALAGFQRVKGGALTWDGRDITHAAPGERPMAMIFQDGNLFPHLSAAANVGLGLRPTLRLSGAEKERVEKALAMVGLEGYGERKPAALSGGQQSRIALARALVMDRPVLLLDEPFAALGPALKDEMLDLVAKVLDSTGATLLMVTHAPSDARRIAPQTVLVSDGRALAPVPTGALLDNPPPALKAYLGD